MNNHFIFKGVTLLDALSQINSLRNAPLVLFVVDEENRMVGTLTDGDSRRALISGFTVDDKVEKIMHKNFKYLLADDVNDVQKIKNQKNMLMKF